MLEYSELTNVVIVSGDQGRDSAIYIHDPFSHKPVSQFLGRLIRRQGSPRRRKGSGVLKEEERTNVFFFLFLFSLSTFLSLSHINFFFSLSPELMIT